MEGAVDVAVVFLKSFTMADTEAVGRFLGVVGEVINMGDGTGVGVILVVEFGLEDEVLFGY